METTPGIHEGKPGDLLVMVFLKKDEETGHVTVTTMYEPNDRDIQGQLVEFGLPVEITMRIVHDRDPLSCTILIDVDQYTSHLLETGAL